MLQNTTEHSEALSISEEAALLLMVIESGSQKFPASIREAFQYRELFFFLVWRDISVKYKQAILGVAWAVL